MQTSEPLATAGTMERDDEPAAIMRKKTQNEQDQSVPARSHRVRSLKQIVPLVPPSEIRVVEFMGNTKWSFLAVHVGESDELSHEKADPSPERSASRNTVHSTTIF